jgi:predicted RNase H-like nuclease (RuvC/YqgF family)
MTAPQSSSEPGQYRSPQRKLVRFFEKSRNQWKAKCRDAKRMVRRLKNRAAWLEHSRDTWKARAMQLRQRVHELETALAHREAGREPLKKTEFPPRKPPLPPS